MSYLKRPYFNAKNDGVTYEIEPREDRHGGPIMVTVTRQVYHVENPGTDQARGGYRPERIWYGGFSDFQKIGEGIQKRFPGATVKAPEVARAA